MHNDVKLPRRRSIRLEGWDYSQVGGYFVTIVPNRRIELFGQIINEEVNLNIGGKIIEAAWRVLSTRFPMVELGEYVIMPNHLHGIIFIREVVLLHRVGRPQGSFEDTTRLGRTGIYRLIRHPMYASLLASGRGAFLKNIYLAGAALVIVLTISACLTAKAEESQNPTKFGLAYREYMQKSRRFIPYLF